MAEFTYDPGLVIDDATGEPAPNVVGEFRASPDGPAVAVYDLLGTPQAGLVTNDAGVVRRFSADIARGYMSFGAVPQAVASDQMQDALPQALAAETAAVNAAGEASSAAAAAAASQAAAEAALAQVEAPAETVVVQVVNDKITAGELLSPTLAQSTYAAKTVLPRSLADYGVLPANTAAQNRAGFDAAVASGFRSFTLPPGDYQWAAAAEGQWAMSFTGAEQVTIRGLGATIIDTTTYTNSGPFTGLFKLDACTDFEVDGIDYVGPILATPSVDLGYRGAILVYAINGTDGIRVRMRATNARYGVVVGDYSDPTKGACKNIDLTLRGTKIGYPLAAYYADGITHDIDVDGIHRVVYIAGCNDVRGVARWRNQYIADTAYLITDAITSGTDAAAQANPTGAATTSRGCSNVDIASIETGGATYQNSSMCAGVTLSRVDPCAFRDVRVRVHVTSTGVSGQRVGGFRIASLAKSVWSRYAFNWEPHVVLDGITVTGISDHTVGPICSSGDLNIVTQDGSAANAAVVRNLDIDMELRQPAASTVATTITIPGLANPMRLRLVQPLVRLDLTTNQTHKTVLRQSEVGVLALGASGGSSVDLGPGTTATSLTQASVATAISTTGGGIGGGLAQIQHKEFPVSLNAASNIFSGAIPANSLVLAVRTRVTTAITGATGFQVGVTGAVTRYADKNAVAVGTTVTPADYTETSPRYYAAATDLVVTAKTSNFTGGVMRVTVTYIPLPALTA